ncbi:MAG: hypothetical protein K0M40_22700 [Prolixibacteraceae bacterium]|nr:hypothetical protein [Prolixibacteraceae bacterium]
MSKNEVARPKVILDGKQAEEELDKLTQKANKYRDAMLAAASVGDSKREKEMARNFKQANTEIRDLKREAFSVEAVLKNINGASFNEIATASRKATAEFKKMKQTDPGYAEAQKNAQLLKTKMSELSKQSGVNISSFEKLKTTAAGLLPAFGFAAIAAGAKYAFDKVVNSTDVLSTKWAVFTGGLQSGMNEFWRTIAVGDWSNFTENMRAAIKVGREYETMLDDIEEKGRALRIKEAQSRGEELRLEEALKNTGLSKSERLAAGQARIKLEDDLAKERVKIAQDTFDAELKVTMQQTRLSKDRLMEVVSDMDSETKIKAKAYLEQQSLYESTLKKNDQFKVAASRSGITENPFAKEIADSKAVLDSYPESVKVYAEAIKGVGSTTDEQLNKMVAGYEGLLSAQNSAAEGTQRVRTMVNSLLAGKQDGGKPTTPADPESAKTATDALDLAYKQQTLLLKQKYAAEETLQKEYAARMLATEIAYMQTKLQVTTDESSRIDLQSQLIDKQLQYAAALKETIPEILNTDNGIQKLNTRLLEESKLLDLAAQKQAEGTAAQETATAKQIQQADTIKMVGDVMTDYVTGALNGSLDEFQTFGDTLILMSLQMLKQMVPIWSAQILGLSLSSPESVASWGVLGLAKYAVITGLMYAGIAAVEGAVKGGINKKREAANGSKQSGGYSNFNGPDSEPDGIYHKNEFIASAPAVRNPTVKPVLDIINLAQQRGTIAKLNLPAVLAVTGMLPTGRQSGGFASEASSLNSATYSGVLGRLAGFNPVDKMQSELLLKLSTAIDNLTMHTQKLETWKPSVSVEMLEQKTAQYNKITTGGLK